MKPVLLLAAVASSIPPSEAATDRTLHHNHAAVAARALSNSPNGYVPSNTTCPRERPKIRMGSGLSSQETEWLQQRRNNTIDPMKTLLKRLTVPGFDIDKFFADAKNKSSNLPTIGIAMSGGGYRALLTGAGALASFDTREQGSTDKGNLGGLLQSATYISGLDTGAWLVGSIWANNYTTVGDSVAYPGIWQFGESLLTGPKTISFSRYYSDIMREVAGKDDADFSVSITDYLGRMASFQLFNDTNGAPGYTYSSIAEDDDFVGGKIALPLIVANGRSPGEQAVSTNSTLYEFNPWEMGSRDPRLSAYVPLKYVGSKFQNGTLRDNSSCVVGLDNVGFVMGTSGSLLNQLVLYIRDKTNAGVPDGIPADMVTALSTLLKNNGDASANIADWSPNPFQGVNDNAGNASSSDVLTLVDGGDDLQNIPFDPLLHPDRHVDVIFAVDSSADTESAWPDGASAVATYQRAVASSTNGSVFPSIPGKDTFLNQKLNTQPTFFGCDAANSTKNGITPPLVVYLPNFPYVYASNISTVQLTVDDPVRDAIILNGWYVATQHNSTRDNAWPTCVACAVLSRSLARTGATVPDACQACFKKYCWNGQLSPEKAKPYWPEFFAQPIQISSSDALSLVALPGFATLAALAASLMFVL